MLTSLFVTILTGCTLSTSTDSAGTCFDPLVGNGPGHVVEVDYEYYLVSGRTPPALLRSMRENGPRGEGERYFGITEWQTSLQYTAEESRNGCRLSDVGVTTDVVVTLPQWREKSQASAAMQSAWEEFLMRLAYHEKGHRDMARRQSNAIYDALTGLSIESGCSSMEFRARALVDETAAQFEELNREYDRASEHGRRQGVVWPPEGWTEWSDAE
jgi:predicted secreted Zn-dependent protease